MFWNKLIVNSQSSFLLENQNLDVGSGEQHKSAFVRTDTVKAKVCFVDETMPDAAVVGHQFIGDSIRELIHIRTGFQCGNRQLLNLLGGCLIETRLGHDKIFQNSSFDKVDQATETKLKDKLIPKSFQNTKYRIVSSIDGDGCLSKLDLNERILDYVVKDKAYVV